MAEKRWIPETLFDDLGFRMTFEVERVLYEMQTEHQHLVLFEHKYFGKMLMLDGATQITKRDEFIYQEMMSHVPIFAHGNAREVLIIGGGDCGIAEEVLKHKSVKRLTQVEIDASVVEFSKEHFPEFTKPVFADKRFESVIDDGMKYVAQDRAALRRHHRGLDRSAGARQGAVQQQLLRRLQALHDAGRRDGHAERGADLPAGRAHLERQESSAGCSPTGAATSPRSRPMSAATWPWAGRPTTRSCAQTPVKTIAERYRKAGSFPTKYWTPEVHAGRLRAAALHRRARRAGWQELTPATARFARQWPTGYSCLTVGE